MTGFRRSPPEPGGAVTLDVVQRQVIDLADGRSAVVIGAPGTGKTTLAIELVVDRVLRRGYAPEQVLVISANRVSATAIRDRLALRLDLPSAGPRARTATSVAYDVVRAHAARRDAPMPTLLTGAEQDAIIAELLAGQHEDGDDGLWPAQLDWPVRSQRRFRTELRELMMRATESGVGPRRLAALAAEHDQPGWRAVADFTVRYRRALDSYREHYRDAAELAAEAAVLIRAGAGGALVDPLRLVLVDDLQEATASTALLLAALAHAGVTIIGLGDPDTSAAAYRGGEPTIVGGFGQALALAECDEFILPTSYRHGPGLRVLVQRSAARIGTAGAGRQRLALPAAPAAAEFAAAGVRTIMAPTPAREAAAIADRLREFHLFSDVPWQRMAVIVRSGGRVDELARQLALADVPTRTSMASRSLREAAAARGLLEVAALAVGHSALSQESVDALLLGPVAGLDMIGLRRLGLALRHQELAGGGNRGRRELLVDALGDAARLAAVPGAAARRAAAFAALLAEARRAAASGSSIEEVLWLIWSGSGRAQEWLAQSEDGGPAAAQADRNLDSVVALFAAAKRFVERQTEPRAARFIDEVLSADIAEDSLAARAANPAVTISTPNAVVGLDFDVVVVAGLQDGVWPNPRVRGSLLGLQEFADLISGAEGVDARRQVISDELRLFTLAISRARHALVLTATVNDDEAPSALFELLADPDVPVESSDSGSGATPAGGHALTLRGLVGALRRAAVAEPQPAVVNALARLAAEHVPGADPAQWHGLMPVSTPAAVFDLTNPNDPVRVSPSRLQGFADSPVRWFVDQFGGGSASLAAGLGTVIHAVMETATSTDPDQLWLGVEEHWPQLSFEAPWIEARQRRSARELVDALAQYLQDTQASGTTLLGAESRFSLRLGPALLNGSIDRVERYSDGSVVIVDLKTGRGEKPTDAAAADHPQLSSYQLAFAEGVVPSVPEGAPSGGAKLVLVAVRRAGKLYAAPVQPALTPEQLDAFRARVVEVAVAMAGPVYHAPLNPPQQGRTPQADIQTLGAVSA